MSDEHEIITVSDLSGKVMQITRAEAYAVLDELRGDDDLSEGLASLRDQLAEFLL